MATVDPGSPPTGPDRASCTVVFGQSTFLGRSLVSALKKSGRWAVRIADTLPPPGPDPIHRDRPAYFQVDVADRSSLCSAVAGSTAVFLVDPLPGFPLPPPGREFPRLHSLSVVCAKNLVPACREAGVRRLVYTGSADVVFDGRNDIRRGDESLPYPDRYEDDLNELRMQVEVSVLSANGKDGLLTCALRPSNIFGPGDSNFVPFLVQVQEARSGISKFVIGKGKNICDLTYVENVVHANISAEHALSVTPASVAGKPFFITNDKPVELWEFIRKVLQNLGYKRPRVHLPVKLAITVVLLVKVVGEKLSSCRLSNSILSPATVGILACSRTFDCSNAKALFGYKPIVSFQEGVELTLESLPQLAKYLGHSQEQDSTITSKADRMLGSGAVADILLWRDEKKTFASVLALFVLFYWFFLSGRSFITSSAKILMVVCLSLFIQGMLPSKMFGSKIEKIPSSCFEVSESTVRFVFFALASLWNEGISAMKLLAQGDDWSIFFKAAGSLYLVKLSMHVPIAVLGSVGLACLFTVFIVYEQCEDEIDTIRKAAGVILEGLTEPLIARLPKFLTENS